MEESNELNEPTPPPPPASLTGRLLNVFAAPGETFDSIKSDKIDHANWYVPLILGCLVGVLASIVLATQPHLVQRIADLQEKVFQKQVDNGKMTEEQKDQILQRLEMLRQPAVMMIGGSLQRILYNVLLIIIIAFVLWLLGRFVFKPPFAFFKGLEVVGLVSMIGVLDAIISIPLMVITGQVQATLSPALFISDFDPTNKSHAMLSALNVFSLWWVAVLSLGLAKISGHSFARAACWLFLIWAIIKFGGIWFMPS